MVEPLHAVEIEGHPLRFYAPPNQSSVWGQAAWLSVDDLAEVLNLDFLRWPNLGARLHFDTHGFAKSIGSTGQTLTPGAWVARFGEVTLCTIQYARAVLPQAINHEIDPDPVQSAIIGGWSDATDKLIEAGVVPPLVTISPSAED